MTESLKPRFKHYKDPRLNALSLAQYCAAADPIERANLLQAARFQRIAGIHQLGDARRSANAYLSDFHRKEATLEIAKNALTRKINAVLGTDFTRETAARNLEALEKFESTKQALGLGRYTFEAAPDKQPHLLLAGVPVSVKLDLFVHVSDSPEGGSRCGAAIVQFAKKGPLAETAKKQETKSRRELRRAEVNRFVSVLIHQHLSESYRERGEPSRDHCIVIDPHAAEVYSVYGRMETQLKRLEVACVEIANQWGSIDPPRDFDL